MNFRSIFSSDFCHSFRYLRESASGMVNIIFMFCKGKYREKSWTTPRRHAEIFGLKGETEFELFCSEISAQDLINRFSERKIGDDHKELFPVSHYSAKTSVVCLETRVHLLQTSLFVCEISVKSFFFSRKKCRYCLVHFLVIAGHWNSFIKKMELIHRVNLLKINIII